ncbi:MAG: hypothetical protein EBX41_05160 [Chitinophagia bacterium]|nr:hypothetical protein [Chitinophagia bacterium]
MKKHFSISHFRFTTLGVLLIALCLIANVSYAQKTTKPAPKKVVKGKFNDTKCRIRSKDLTIEGGDDNPTNPTINANITIYLKNGGTMNFSGANAGNTSYFVSNESYGEGTKYNMTVSGYGRVAVLAFNYTNNRWEYLTEGAGGVNNGTASKDVVIESESDGSVELPSNGADGKRRFFTLRGAGHTYEQFLVLLSNVPLDASKLNMLTNSTANGTAIISEAARIFNSVAPDFTYTPSTITNVNISNGGKGAEITPLYFQINRQ